jgi:acetyl-CoA acyltransferase
VRPVFVLDALRTPIDGRGGQLSGWHPADLAGVLLAALAERSGFSPEEVGDVLLGCAMPVGSQGFNVARSAVLAAGWPESVPGGTIDRQAVSSTAALAAGFHAVASGACELVVAGGVDVMSTTPHGATLVPGAVPFGPAVAERYRDAGGLVPAGLAAERLALELGLDRSAVDAVAARSHRRACAAESAGVLPVPARVLDRDKGEVISSGTLIATDRLPRADLTVEELAAHQPLFEADGLVTAGNAAPAADGAAAVVLTSEAVAERLRRDPLARVASAVVTGANPVGHFGGAAGAATAALAEAGVALDAVDRVEIAEPFAAVAAAWELALGIAPGTANPQGGGVATGEPTGAVGAILATTLAHALAAKLATAGLVVVAGSGLGSAVVLSLG